MRIKISKDKIENKRKICIIFDVSTTLSKKTMLVLCLRCAIGDSHEVNTFFFVDIIELNCTSAESINWLELAVGDTLKEVHGLNHFQCFFEKLYSLYHQFTKNMTELKKFAESLKQII